jgi:glycine dehydrogenase subunit 1
MYDGSTALAEACLMAYRITGRETVVTSDSLHPEYRQVLETYLNAAGMKLKVIKSSGGIVDLNEIETAVDGDTACFAVQNPNFFGCVEDVKETAGIVHRKDALLVSCIIEATSLGLLKPPAEADIVVGEGQGLGNPVSYGGPHFGFMATREEYVRKMPGRLVGATVDAEGRLGFVLTLQAREQHIRREKATSNICTSEALNAIAASAYLALLGPRGLREVALSSHRNAVYLSERLAGLDGFELVFKRPFYNEFLVKCRGDVSAGFDVGFHYPELGGRRLFCCTELHSKDVIDSFIDAVEGVVE